MWTLNRSGSYSHSNGPVDLCTKICHVGIGRSCGDRQDCRMIVALGSEVTLCLRKCRVRVLCLPRGEILQVGSTPSRVVDPKTFDSQDAHQAGRYLNIHGAHLWVIRIPFALWLNQHVMAQTSSGHCIPNLPRWAMWGDRAPIFGAFQVFQVVNYVLLEPL